MIVQQMQQLLALYGQVASTGIVTPQNFYYAMKELIKAMGFKNTDDFVTQPQFMQAIMGLIQMLMQSGIAQQVPQIGQAMQGVMASLGMNQPQGQGQGSPNDMPSNMQPEQPTQPRQLPPMPQAGNGDLWG
jgi:hypothetical protein